MRERVNAADRGAASPVSRERRSATRGSRAQVGAAMVLTCATTFALLETIHHLFFTPQIFA